MRETGDMIAVATVRRLNADVRRGRPPRLRDRGSGHQRQWQRHRRQPWRSPRRRGPASGPGQGSASPSRLPRRRSCSGRSTTSTSLTETELTNIFANLNFDMLGSPNPVRFVFDGDSSDGAPTPPPGRPRSRPFSPTLSPAHLWPARDGFRGRPTTVRSSRRHPSGRPVHRSRGIRRRGHPDFGARPLSLRSMLSPGLRHHQQSEHQGLLRDQ